ncbi:MAG: uroporphyrinogen-III synthase [Halioglobus sp.]
MAADSSTAVLVTRPEGAAALDLCQKVSEAGFTAYSQPLLALHALDTLGDEARHAVFELDAFEHVIFVSANAVRFGMEQIGNVWPQLPVALQWYAIGGATQALLGSYGVHAQAPAQQMTSEGLLALPSLQAINGRRVLLVKGVGGRDKLRTELELRGAKVSELACYERQLPRLETGELAKKLTQWEIAVVLLSSGEGLANLELLLSPSETTNFTHICLIVPSKRVAQLAQDAGFKAVITAKNASDAAMLQALTTWNAGSGD